MSSFNIFQSGNGNTVIGNINGSVVIQNGRITINGQDIKEFDGKSITIELHGNVKSLQCDAPVTVEGDVKDLQCQGSAHITGSVKGNVKCYGSCHCGPIHGNLQAMGSVHHG